MAIRPLRNEQDLLAKIAGGDERAFTELFEGYYAALGEFVFKITESLPVTQEIVQDTFIKIWLKRESLLEVKSFSDYLFIICRNQTYNQLRKVANQRHTHIRIDDYLTNETEVGDDRVEIDMYRSMIDRSIDKLPDQAKKVYLLSRHERLKHDEIGQKLNISKETVKKHIQYAVSFIKNDVKSQIDIGIVAVLTGILINR